MIDWLNHYANEYFSSIHNLDEAAAAIGSFIALTVSIFQ